MSKEPFKWLAGSHRPSLHSTDNPKALNVLVIADGTDRAPYHFLLIATVISFAAAVTAASMAITFFILPPDG